MAKTAAILGPDGVVENLILIPDDENYTPPSGFTMKVLTEEETNPRVYPARGWQWNPNVPDWVQPPVKGPRG